MKNWQGITTTRLTLGFEVTVSRDNRDLTQQGRHRRGQRLRQCDLIDCITVFQSEFEKSFISFSALVEFTRSLLFFCNVRKLTLTIFNEREGLRTCFGFR